MNRDLNRLLDIVGDKQFDKIKAEAVKFLGFEGYVGLDSKLEEYPNQKSLTSIFYTIAYKYNKNETEKSEILTKIFTNSK